MESANIECKKKLNVNLQKYLICNFDVVSINCRKKDGLQVFICLQEAKNLACGYLTDSI